MSADDSRSGFCVHCGHVVHRDDEFCGGCGAAIEAVAEATDVMPSDVVAETDTADPEVESATLATPVVSPPAPPSSPSASGEGVQSTAPTVQAPLAPLAGTSPPGLDGVTDPSPPSAATGVGVAPAVPPGATAGGEPLATAAGGRSAVTAVTVAIGAMALVAAGLAVLWRDRLLIVVAAGIAVVMVGAVIVGVRRRRAHGLPRGRAVLGAAAVVVALVAASGVYLAVTSTCEERLGSNADLEGCAFVGEDLAGEDLQGATLTGADLTGADLSGVDLRSTDLTGVSLSEANLAGADLRAVRLEGVDLSGADLTEAQLSGAELVDVDLAGAVLDDVQARRTVFQGAGLQAASVNGADFSGATFDGSILTDIDLRSAALGGSTFIGSDLDATEWEGVTHSNVTIRNSRLVGAELGGANLPGVTMDNVSLQGSDLIGLTVSDDALASALNVDPPDLPRALSVEDLRLESVEAVQQAAGSLCQGGRPAGAGTAPTGSYDAFMLVGDVPTDAPTTTAPPAVRFLKVVGCFGPEQDIQVEVCTNYVFTATNLPAPDVTLHQHTRTVRVIEARTGAILLDQTVEGSVPSCPFETSQDHIHGSSPPWPAGIVDEIRALSHR